MDAATVSGVIAADDLVSRLKIIEPDWGPRLEKFWSDTEPTRSRTIAASEQFAEQIPHYGRPACKSFATSLQKHLDRHCMGGEHLLNAFVTSCQLESFFAVIDYVNRTSNFISVTENRGQAMAIKSHTFMTADERLRQEVRRRKKCKEEPMTREEAEAYLELEPLAGWCTPTEEEKEYLYIQRKKTWYHDCRVLPKLQVAAQHKRSLSKKRKRKEEKETTDAAKRTHSICCL